MHPIHTTHQPQLPLTTILALSPIAPVSKHSTASVVLADMASPTICCLRFQLLIFSGEKETVPENLSVSLYGKA